ncbi:hypothetical protein QYF36_015554 [Acer negundo]|nr:hypothetical protein QYF36_015554 [Acer negundo]
MSISISMELAVFTSFHSVSSKRVCYNSFVCFGQKLKSNSKPLLRITTMSSRRQTDSKYVEVIGIGSRKDAVLDFCFDSPLYSSSSLRFWNILMKDSSNAQLQQRFLGKDLTTRIVEVPQLLQSCSKAIVLVAGAGYGSDHIAVINILKAIKLTDTYAIAIILKPFSFEGRRRLDEVEDLVAKIQEHTNFCIDIETDRLLEKDCVTLDEALKTANNAVLLAISAISVLVSDMHTKLIDVLHNNVKELEAAEVIKILRNYKEAKVGFGAGSNFKTSILQAIYDCPFIGARVKDLDGTVICIVSSSNPIDNNDLPAFLHTFRQTTEYTREIVISVVHEPNLEPNLLITTVVTLGSFERQTSRDTSILSRLAHHFPFVFNLLRRHYPRSNNTPGNNGLENAHHSKVISPSDSSETEDNISVEGVAEGSDNNSEEVQTVFSNYNYIDTSISSNHSSGSGQFEAELYNARTEPCSLYDQISEGTHALQREPLNSWNLGPGHHIAQEWAKEREADPGATPMLDNLSIFCLPVGVRPSEQLSDGVGNTHTTQQQELKSEDDVKALPTVSSNISSLGALTGASFEVVRDFYSTASTLLKGKTVDARKKQGVLSVRAASMLEAERDSPKKWTPVMEMQYRGGVYRGRCQGGLPEGKGRLILGDGSIYDGVWRYGKRSGLGTFYFSNGDVFQGSWRDDVMHGKGWFYFHTGDRWFANFWKGKANGKGRFYSKSGEIFFGHFQDGWRHGHFLCIDVDGERCIEIWDEGVRLSRKPFDSDTDAE